MSSHPSQSVTADPLSDSLWGEYARLLLGGFAVCSAAAWATQIAAGPKPVVMVILNLAILGVTVSNRFAGLPRLAALLLLAVAALGVFASSQDASARSQPELFFSPTITFLALALLLARDGWIAVRAWAGSYPIKSLIAVAALSGLTIYMVVVPTVDAMLEPYRDRPSSYVIEDLTLAQMLRVRSAKLAIFAVFAYAGACCGSFLNVVAASLPRGETVVLRSSACPRCETPIRRIDNLPIISYLRLGGRCRSCGTEIPVRYLLVELCGMAIFSLLFLYELVTGAANVPGFQRYTFTGILWIILYTKWPVVGIYLFHCGLMCVLLTLALMDSDRKRCPRWFAGVLGIAFAVMPLVAPTLLPVRFDEHLPLNVATSLPPHLSQAIAVAVGGIVGALAGRLAGRVRILRRAKNLPLALTLIGLSLGWQAVLTISVLFFVTVWLSSSRIERSYAIATRWATMLLFLLTMIHHPLWKTIDGLW